MIKCACCGKTPSELKEYITNASVEGITPDEFVRTQEGTFNPETEEFYCTQCYIEIGMPSGRA